MASNNGVVRDIGQLKSVATTLRRHIIRQIHAAQSGHPGGSLSAVEILTALYWGGYVHRDPADPMNPDRDRLILSKGHGCPALYAALVERGFLDENVLDTFRQIDSPLQGHPDSELWDIMEASTGSLGQGLSIGIGMALSARLDKKDYHTYVILGDGECDEGQIWEAAMFANHFNVDNLTCIVDYNKIQLDGRVEEIMKLEPFADKWKSFGWEVRQVDGHDFTALFNALDQRRNYPGKPFVILADTIKGKGVSFMENEVGWHGVPPNDEQAAKAYEELVTS